MTSCTYQSAIDYPRLTRVQSSQLREKVDRAVAQKASDLNLGMKVVSLKTGEVIYERNGNHLFTPASNTKLITAAAALHILGPHYRFRTAVYSDSPLSSAVLKGNLYLKGSGDPELTDEDLEEMVHDLQLQGLTTIQGNLVIDGSEFDSDPWGPGWMWDQGSHWFSAPVDAVTLNDNCVIVRVTPAARSGTPPMVRIDPPTKYVSTEVEAVTVSGDSLRNGLTVERRWRTRENIIDITGAISIHESPRDYVVSIENPALYTGTVLEELLQESGIELTGEVIQDSVPRRAVPLVVHTSRPLSESVKNFLKVSHNLTGELLLKKIGGETEGLPGSWKKGLKSIKTFLQNEVRVDTTTLVMADGSGSSRYNLLSPDHVVRLLAWAHDNFQLFPEFSSALPIGG
ncbi:MAG: D-alanyl-D-alanine carboxypeptidase/D-alanyl-D-alanine-endopeptidase, partial [Fidelibacterota bacterium]